LIVFDSRVSYEDKERSNIKITIKKVKQVNLFDSVNISMFDSFWASIDKPFKDAYVKKVLVLFNRVFSEILMDTNFSNNNLSKILSKFNVYFLSNLKPFLSLSNKEKIMLMKIICKSGKMCFKDNDNKCYDMEYIRKLNSFLGSFCSIENGN